MQFNISVLSCVTSTKTGKTGKPYQEVEVAYKDLNQNKVASKKIFSFSPIFKVAAGAQPGQQFTVEAQKPGEYWEWVSMTQLPPGTEQASTAAPTASKGSTTPITKSTYETAEERAARQVLIVKQSSISAAVAILSPGAKSSLKVEDVLSTAQTLTDWVFGNKLGAQALIDMPNDLDNSDNLPE